MGFMVLGCPRSGTNLLSSIIRMIPRCILQIEPYSMHTSNTLKWDLIGQSPVRDSLLNTRKVHPLTDHVARFLACDKHNFIKETSMFEHLDILGSLLRDIKIIYIWRNEKDVTESFVKHGLYKKWRLYERVFFGVWADMLNIDPLSVDSTAIRMYAKATTNLKKEYWNTYKKNYEHIELSYDDMVKDPIYSLNRLCDFIECKNVDTGQIIKNINISRNREMLYEYATLN